MDREALKSLAIGLGLAVGILLVPFLRFVLGYLTILVHELGHAVAGWLFGYPSIPAFDFRYGGGVTGHESRQLPIVIAVLGALGYAIWYCRRHRLAAAIAGAATALYALAAFTPLHQALITFMGHGSELVFAGIFLYRAISGSAIKHAVERPLYAMVGFFIVLSDMRFAWGLIHDAGARAAYEEAKGGGHWMDFSLLAERHLQMELATVAGLFWLACLIPPLAAWLVYSRKRISQVPAGR
jgi:hypothetical protein